MSGSRRNECNTPDLIERLRTARLNAIKMREDNVALRRRMPGADGIPSPPHAPHAPASDAAIVHRPPATQLLTVGGSAGAMISALHLLATLPRSFDAAVAVALHASGGDLVTLIRNRSQLPVKWAATSDVLRAGCVYVSPANHHLIVNADLSLTVSSSPRLRLFRPSVDWLFTSAAAAFNERHVSVILSGRLNDGAEGVRAVVRCGGTAYVQDPESCAFGDMPRAAIETGCVRPAMSLKLLTAAILDSVSVNTERSTELWSQPFAS